MVGMLGISRRGRKVRKVRLNDTGAVRNMGDGPGLRHPGSTLFGDEVRGNFISDEALPTTTQLLFRLGDRPISSASPDRGAAGLYRERRLPAGFAGGGRCLP